MFEGETQIGVGMGEMSVHACFAVQKADEQHLCWMTNWMLLVDLIKMVMEICEARERESERKREREREKEGKEALSGAIQRWGSHRSTLRLFDGSHTSLTWTNRADICDELTLPRALNEMRKWSVNQSLRCCGIHYWSDLTAHRQTDIPLANQSCLKNENESRVEKRKILNQPNWKRKLNEHPLRASMNW